MLTLIMSGAWFKRTAIGLTRPRDGYYRLFVKEIEMAARKKAIPKSAPVRETLEAHGQQAAMPERTYLKTHVAQQCKDCRVDNAFHAWRDQHLTPSFNWSIDF